MDEFNSAAGKAAKADGMARAARSANPEWWNFMLNAVRETCVRKPYLFTDDIEKLRLTRDGPSTHENRAIGPLMNYAKKLGYCAPTDHWIPSSQRVNHGRYMRVWYSLIYQGNRVVRRPRRLRVIDPRQFDFPL